MLFAHGQTRNHAKRSKDYFKTRSYENEIFIYLIVASTAYLTSCKAPESGSDKLPNLQSLTIYNSQNGSAVGSTLNNDPNNFVDKRVQVMVTTLDANMNAVLYKKGATKNYVCDKEHPNFTFNLEVEVPTSGGFTITVTTEGKECTWVNMSTNACLSNFTNSTKQSYHEIHTFANQNEFQKYIFSKLDKFYDECCS